MSLPVDRNPVYCSCMLLSGWPQNTTQVITNIIGEWNKHACRCLHSWLQFHNILQAFVDLDQYNDCIEALHMSIQSKKIKCFIQNFLMKSFYVGRWSYCGVCAKRMVNNGPILTIWRPSEFLVTNKIVSTYNQIFTGYIHLKIASLDAP